ncbi:MAG: phosphoenolpyruvate carboxykinase [Chloroflexota bacterium]
MNTVLGKQFVPEKIIDNPSDETLREWSLLQGGIVTEFGNLSVVSQVRNRMAKLTEVIMGDPDQEDQELIDEVLAYLKGKEMIMLDRTMCMEPEFKKACRLYVTSEYARLPLMWGNTLFPPEGREPDFVTIAVPEWREKKVLVFPEMGLTIVLGSDYKGEQKKAMLRQVMYWAKKEGNLGLHAAGKILKVKREGKLKDFGFLLFGLSGTGKTTLSCHSHWLGFPESVVIRQDDVVILKKDATGVGTEDSFYIKTDGLEPSSQPLLYAAALSPRAILENVTVAPQTGKVDFSDTSLTSNGRAMVKRKDIAFTDNQVDMGHVDAILFITRREDIQPPVVRLTPEWGAAAFMLGESVETSAGDPDQAGKSIRVVGTNPFIVGSHSDEGNIFLEILRQNPHIECFILNTGSVGGGARGQKIMVKHSAKVMEMIARDEIKWQRDDFWGYDVPTEIPGMDVDRFDPKNYYSEDQMEKLSSDLKKERRDWLLQFESLDEDILNVLRD